MHSVQIFFDYASFNVLWINIQTIEFENNEIKYVKIRKRNSEKRVRARSTNVKRVLKEVEMFKRVPTTVWRCNAVQSSDSSLLYDYIYVNKDHSVLGIVFFSYL